VEEYQEGLGWGMFSSHTKFEVGDGFNIILWYDLWCGDKALKEAFPNLFSIACMNDTYVAVHLELSSSFHQWNVSLVKAAHDWEWALSKKELFDVRSFYSVLVCNDGTPFP
jgi:hypothetical protein